MTKLLLILIINHIYIWNLANVDMINKRCVTLKKIKKIYSGRVVNSLVYINTDSWELSYYRSLTHSTSDSLRRTSHYAEHGGVDIKIDVKYNIILDMDEK